MRTRRFAVFPAVDVGFHNPAGIIDVIAVETGAMIDVFPNNVEATDRGAVSFAAAGNARRSRAMFTAIQVGLLLANIDHDGGASGVPLRDVRRHEVADRVVGAATA